MKLFLRDVRLLAANDVEDEEVARRASGCEVCGCALPVGQRGRCIDHALRLAPRAGRPRPHGRRAA